MNIVRVGDIGAYFISYLTLIFLLIFIAGAILIFIKAFIPGLKGLKKGETGQKNLKTAAIFLGVWLLVTCGIGYGFYKIYTDTHSVKIEKDGTWVLRNPFTITIGEIPGNSMRKVGVGSHSSTFYRSSGSVSTTHFTDFYVLTEKNKLWQLSSADGARVLKELGYENLATMPVETSSDGSYRIESHKYGSNGPIFSESSNYTPKEKGITPPRTNETEPTFMPTIGTEIFSLWQDDGYWYPATVLDISNSNLFVRFKDGTEVQTNFNQNRPLTIPDNAKVEANWNNQGKYWPCKIIVQDGNVFNVQFEDGSKDTINIEQIRFSLGDM